MVFEKNAKVLLKQYGLNGSAFSSFSENTTKEYVFDGTQPIIEYDNDGGSRTVEKQYYWGAGLPGGIGGLLCMKVPGSPDAYYYYHYDGGGNVTCITDADKDIMALYEYDAFGNIITKCGSLANDFLFSTQLANANAGWYMYMYRNYDPMLGRWTQREPLGLDGPNLYHFLINDPINNLDYLGMQVIIGPVNPGGDEFGPPWEDEIPDDYGLNADLEELRRIGYPSEAIRKMEETGMFIGPGPDWAHDYALRCRELEEEEKEERRRKREAKERRKKERLRRRRSRRNPWWRNLEREIMREIYRRFPIHR